MYSRVVLLRKEVFVFKETSCKRRSEEVDKRITTQGVRKRQVQEKGLLLVIQNNWYPFKTRNDPVHYLPPFDGIRERDKF